MQKPSSSTDFVCSLFLTDPSSLTIWGESSTHTEIQDQLSSSVYKRVLQTQDQHYSTQSIVILLIYKHLDISKTHIIGYVGVFLTIKPGIALFWIYAAPGSA